MKIRENSSADFILEMLTDCEQLPLSFLNLVPNVKFDSAKATLQKLIRAGYVTKQVPKEITVPKKKGKSASKPSSTKQRQYPVYSLTKAGFESYNAGFDVSFSRSHYEYDLARISAYARCKEAWLMMAEAGIIEFYTSSRTYKHDLRRNGERNADSIKGSGFAGVLRTEDNFIATYNFGTRNKRMRVATERALASHVQGDIYRTFQNSDMRYPSMLILGEEDTALLNILKYHEDIQKKSAKQLAFIQQSFHLNLLGMGSYMHYFYLPVIREALPLLHMMRRKDWVEYSRNVVETSAEHYFNCLSCTINDYILAKELLAKYGKLEIHCYGWQIPILKEYLQSDNVTYCEYSTWKKWIFDNTEMKYIDSSGIQRR